METENIELQKQKCSNTNLYTEECNSLLLKNGKIQNSLVRR